MKPYIFGDRNGVHIIDLSQTVPLFARALDFVSQTVASGGKVLFVGTKRQAQDPIAEAARRSGQHFVNHRWLGGMLTNWKTISNSIKRFKSARGAALGRHPGPDQEGSPSAHPRARQAGAVARRHPRHGRPAGRDVRDRRQQGRAGDQGSQHARHPGRRDPRFERATRRASPSRSRRNDDASRAIRLYCDAIAEAATCGKPGRPRSPRRGPRRDGRAAGGSRARRSIYRPSSMRGSCSSRGGLNGLRPASAYFKPF